LVRRKSGVERPTGGEGWKKEKEKEGNQKKNPTEKKRETLPNVKRGDSTERENL